MDCTPTPETAVAELEYPAAAILNASSGDVYEHTTSLHLLLLFGAVAEAFENKAMSPQERSCALIDAVVAKAYAELKAGESAFSVHFSAFENKDMRPQERSGAVIRAAVAAFADIEAGKFATALRAERERNKEILTRAFGKPAPPDFPRAVADAFGVSAVPDAFGVIY